jgi:Tol biopolymer transport system component
LPVNPNDLKKTFLLIAIITFFIGCRKDRIDFDKKIVESIETWDESGGRVDWHPNNNKILFDRENQGRFDLYISNPERTSQTNLTESMTGKTIDGQYIEPWQHRGQPAWHPTGNYLVFQVMNEHANSTPETEEFLSLGVNNDLWFMHADGTHIQKLTDNPSGYAVLHAHFSHSGNKIMWAERYADDESASIFGAWRIAIADFSIDNNGFALLTNKTTIQPQGAKWYETHSFSTDDSKIYFSGNLTTDHKASNIYSYDLNSGALTNLTNEPSQWHEMYNICPTNKDKFSFISSCFFKWNNNLGWATLRTELYIYDGEVKQLTYYNQTKKRNSKKLTSTHYFIGDHCWSPDGKSLLAVLAGAKIGKTSNKIVKINLK